MVRTGLPASIIKKYGVTKKAWRIYRQKHPKTNKRRRSSNPKVKRVARRRRYTRRQYVRRSRRRAKKTIPILPIISLAPPAANFITWVKEPLMAGNFEGAAYNAAYTLLKDFVGYDLNEQRFTGGNLIQTYGAIAAGYIGHRLANMFGVNRIFKNLPRPLNKLRL